MMIYFLANTEHTINRVMELMGHGWIGYFVLFGLLFSCGLGVPIPEDIPLLVAGFLVGSGKMYLAPAGVLAWCGIIGGDCVLYSLGRKYGLNITKVPFIGKHVTKDRIVHAENLFAKYGILVVAVGRLFAGIRGAMVIAAGTIRFNVAKFLIADGLAAIVSGGLFIWLGHAAGKKMGEKGNLKIVAEQIDRFGLYVLIAVVVSVGLFMFWKSRQAKPVPHTSNADADICSEPTQAVTESLQSGSEK